MLKRYWQMLLPGLLLLSAAGCSDFKSLFKEAISDGPVEESTDPKSDDYKPKYVLGIFEIIQYPRGTNLERKVVGIDGKSVWTNANQSVSSKQIQEATAIARPGNPDVFDLRLKLDRIGKINWQVMAANHRDERMALVIDGVYFGQIITEIPEDEESDWVILRCGLDPITARGFVKYADKNYIYYNPDSKSWFK